MVETRRSSSSSKKRHSPSGSSALPSGKRSKVFFLFKENFIYKISLLIVFLVAGFLLIFKIRVRGRV